MAFVAGLPEGRSMQRLIRPVAIAVVALSLAACLGHSDNSNPASVAAVRGTLIGSPASTGSYSTSDLLSLLTGDPLGQELLHLTFTPTCTVTVYHFEYHTVGGTDEATTASAALMVPSGNSATCQGEHPEVMYAHGTNTSRTFNMADLSRASEAVLMAAVFAADGYIVIAPNYAGYDTSSLAYHPYLNADQQSKDMIDALTAARSAYSRLDTTSNGKLYITGYSQGGYVAMATHKAMQASGSAVTASAPMSGPFALAAFGDAIFLGQVNSSAAVNFNLAVTSYQHSYGNVYSEPTDVYEARYAATADELLPSTTPIATIYANGEFPQSALFNSTPPDPHYASITPATMPAALAKVFAQGFGTDNLVTNAYRLKYLQDQAAHPDGGFPTTTSGAPASAPDLGLRQDLKTNDLRDWAPTEPVLLCAGNMDPTVFYLNTQLMQGYWSAQAPSAPASVLDVDSGVVDNDPYADEKKAFAAVKAAVATAAVVGGASDGGAGAVLQDYHTKLVPPFCLFAVKSFFDSH